MLARGVATAISVCAVVCAGCHGDLFELPAGQDAGPPDLAAVDAPVGPVFFPAIQMDLDALACSTAQCHGSGATPMKVTPMPSGDAALRANYIEVKARAQMGAMSLLLVKSLEGSAVTHIGGKRFASTGDPVYQRWLAWIDANAPYSPDGGTQ
jgi:hypothetical protein